MSANEVSLLDTFKKSKHAQEFAKKTSFPSSL
jgi:hypothetical protein